MKTVGIVGGIGPESTVEYYRSIIAAYRELRPEGGYPPILINSIDLTRIGVEHRNVRPHRSYHSWCSKRQ